MAKKTRPKCAILDASPKQPEREITLVAVSDIHAGSRNAICVPRMEFVDGDGAIQHSASQRALYDSWGSLAKEWGKPDILLCTGDAIEGQARKESGVKTWSTDLWDQVKCAELLLKEWQAKHHYIIDGTGYHVDAAGKSLEFYLGERLNAEKIGPGGTHSSDEVFLKVHNATFNAAHHIQVGSGWYKTTPMARELCLALLNESHKHKVDVVLRGHVHTFSGVEFTRQRGYTLPCWQLQTRYMRRKSSLGMVPDIGAVRFRVTSSEIRMDKRFFKPVEIKPKLFVFDQTDKPNHEENGIN